ncbi:MAG: sulfatase [Saprospiraceae bacterium]
MIVRNKIIFILLIILSFVSFRSTHSIRSTTPNIVIIFFDDLGYGDLSCYGALDIQTPLMDHLAHEGIRFTNFLSAQAVCSASRAALLTGCYPNRIGIYGALNPDSKIGIGNTEITLADVLRNKGYHTAIYGKWHLGDHRENLPLQHGFDEYFGIPYSNDMWPVNYDGTPANEGPKLRFPTLPLITNNVKTDSVMTLEDQAKLTKRYTQKAVAFIQKNKNHPFFLYMPHSMPHVPINASHDFKGSSRQGLYGDVIQELDWSVGQIVQTLKKNKLDKNTLILLTSDNGPWLNFGNHSGNTGGFREGKGTTFEGGHRVPFIARWKGTLPEGMVCNQLCSTIDFLPTIATLTGCPLPPLKIDGVDISSLFFNPQGVSPRSLFYYYYRQNSLEAIRKDNWKLVFEHPGRSYKNQIPGHDGFPGPLPENEPINPGLYDLRRDPGEQYDVSLDHPEIIAELMKLADDARKDLGDDLKNIKGSGRRNVH